MAGRVLGAGLDSRDEAVKLRFEGFDFDDEARLLARGKEQLKLTPKAFELLAYLLEQRPRAVNKPQIRDRIWPTTIVAEVNLHALVNELRRTLGDDARRARFIRTVRGFGYAFCAKATAVTAAGVAPQAEAGGRQVRLIWRKRELVLEPGDHVLGRTREASLWVDHKSVSRRHAVVRVAPDVAQIEDCGSKNGTFVNGTRIASPIPLHDGDAIRLGRAELSLKVFTDGEGTETARES